MLLKLPTTQKKCWNYFFLYGNVFSKIIKSSLRERKEYILQETRLSEHTANEKRELHEKHQQQKMSNSRKVTNNRKIIHNYYTNRLDFFLLQLKMILLQVLRATDIFTSQIFEKSRVTFHSSVQSFFSLLSVNLYRNHASNWLYKWYPSTGKL